MPIRPVQWSLFTLLLCACWQVLADDSDVPSVKLNGYGTLGLVHSSERQADFTSSLLKPDGAGYTHAWSADVDSRLGLQAIADIAPKLSATVQVVAEQRYDDSYVPIVEWANVKYQFTPDFRLRFGRIALPTFLEADYRKVGYAIAWVRTPTEVDELVPITNSDGIDASYRLHFGEVNSTFQLAYGKTKLNYPGNGAGKVTAIKGITDTTEFGSATIRISYLSGDLTIDLADPLFAAFTQFGRPGQVIADEYAAHGKATHFVGIGANYDPGEWFVTGEWGRTSTHSFLGTKSGWYVGGGYRVGNYTPYADVAGTIVESNSTDPGIDPSTLPPQLAPVAAGLDAGLNALLQAKGAQHTVALGLRWDFSKSAALKIQDDFIRLAKGSSGYLTNVQPGFVAGGKLNVFSLALNFVF